MSGIEKYDETVELEIDISDVLRDILKDWWLILMMGLTAAMCAYIIVNVTYKPVYSVRSTFVVTSKGSNNTYANLSAANTVANSLTNIFASNVLKKKVALDIGMNEVPGNIRAEVIPETNLFVLKVTAPGSDLAFRIITSVMRNYTSVTNQVFGNAILDVLESPTIPAYPDNPINATEIMKLAFWIGIVVMTGLIAVMSCLRDNVKNESEVTKKLDTKLFGTIYHEKKYKTFPLRFNSKKKSILVIHPTVSFSFVESFKKMRTKLEYKAEQNSYKVILVTSTLENEGKSTVAVNLALSLAQKSKKVLLIDADLCRPSLYKILQRNVEPGHEIGEGIRKNNLNETLTFDDNYGLYLTLGSRRYENSADFIVKEAFLNFIKVSRKMMDYIIIDAPPISAVTDTEILADLVDASLLVVRQSTAMTKNINDAIDVITESKSELLGCVYNNVRTSLFGYNSEYVRKNSYERYYANAQRKAGYGVKYE